MGAKLTPLGCREIERKLRALGFVKDHEDGNIRHWFRMRQGKEQVVQVHWHPGERGIDIIQSVLRTGGISREEWLSA
jgi:predicted RNA binding protein YcfA (HicA-like mRNA interferase family)